MIKQRKLYTTTSVSFVCIEQLTALSLYSFSPNGRFEFFVCPQKHDSIPMCDAPEEHAKQTLTVRLWLIVRQEYVRPLLRSLVSRSARFYILMVLHIRLLVRIHYVGHASTCRPFCMRINIIICISIRMSPICVPVRNVLYQ